MLHWKQHRENLKRGAAGPTMWVQTLAKLSSLRYKGVTKRSTFSANDHGLHRRWWLGLLSKDRFRCISFVWANLQDGDLLLWRTSALGGGETALEFSFSYWTLCCVIFLYGIMCIWFKFTLIGYTNGYEALGLSFHVVDNKTRQQYTV